MGRIHVLDKTVSNMIAAGEVVERPASVAKELLENSMDANASHITVEIKSGGISYIRVMDDGCGMSAEDAQTCLLRHATSKIADAEDLAAIRTLGFRGEALASIAAVSKLDIYTRAAGEETGTHVSCECGDAAQVQEAGCPVGTTMIVRDLFCSTPARMKFLKKDFTEAGYIADMLNRLALSHPEISFKFINNGKEQLFTSGNGELSDCVGAVFGRETRQSMVPADYAQPPVRVHGLTGLGAIARPNRNMQNFFVNGRYIKSPLLARAAEDAYKNEVMVGKFPVFVLNIELDPSLVDINVHPTKLEAKFADEKAMYHCVYWAVKNALYQNVHIPKVEKESRQKAFEMPQTETLRQETSPVRVEEFTEQRPKSYMQDMNQAVQKPRTENAERTSFAAENAPMPKGRATMREAVLSWAKEDVSPQDKPGKWWSDEAERMRTRKECESTEKPQQTDSEPPREKSAVPQGEEKQREEKQSEKVFSDTEYRICGQIFDTYLIVEKDGEMLMVDQHAAHERLRFEELLRQYRSRTVAAQSLLIPAVVTLSPQEMAVYRENQEEFSALGFDTEEFGENTVAVRATPEELSEREIGSLLVEIITQLSDHRKNIGEDLVSRMLYSIACKGAIKANHSLHGEEMKALLDAVFALEGINTCPHGRPITIAFSKEFIEKQFKRIV